MVQWTRSMFNLINWCAFVSKQNWSADHNICTYMFDFMRIIVTNSIQRSQLKFQWETKSGIVIILCCIHINCLDELHSGDWCCCAAQLLQTMAKITYFDFCGFALLGLFVFVCIVCGLTIVREFFSSGYFVKTSCTLEGEFVEFANLKRICYGKLRSLDILKKKFCKL